MHEAMSPDNLYLRFFSISPLVPEREAGRVCGEAEAGRAALLALSGDEVVGCASYEPAPGGHAEIAFAVADRMHRKGIHHQVGRNRFLGPARTSPTPPALPGVTIVSPAAVTGLETTDGRVTATRVRIRCSSSGRVSPMAVSPE